MSKNVLVLYPRQSYIKALTAVGLTPVFDLYKLADGLVLTGGGDLSPCSYGEPNYASKNLSIIRDQTEFLAIKKYVEKNLPILGICRGMQAVNVFFGGSLFQDVKLHGKIASGDRLHTVYTLKGSVMHKVYGEKTVVNSAHHQAVKRIGKPLKITSYSSDGIIESLEYKNILLTQFHPERLGHRGLLLFDCFKNFFK